MEKIEINVNSMRIVVETHPVQGAIIRIYNKHNVEIEMLHVGGDLKK